MADEGEKANREEENLFFALYAGEPSRIAVLFFGSQLLAQAGRVDEALELWRRAIDLQNISSMDTHTGLQSLDEPTQMKLRELAGMQYLRGSLQGNLKRSKDHVLLGNIIRRLQDLEEWRLESLSAETLGLDRGAQEMVRALPVRYYVSTTDRDVADEVERALELVLDDLNFEVTKTYPIVEGSWFRKLIFVSRQRITNESIAEDLAKIQRSAAVRALDLPQSQVDANRADSVAKLLTSLENTPSALIQIGSILLVKTDGTPIAINLTPRELSEMERNPHLFRSPVEALNLLQKIRQENSGDLTPLGSEHPPAINSRSFSREQF